MALLTVCPRCRGAGTLRDDRGVPRLCPHCRGEGIYRGRPYEAARRCTSCARVFNPPAGHVTERRCHWCRRPRVRPAACRECGRQLVYSGRGRPRIHCEIHARNRYCDGCGRRATHRPATASPVYCRACRPLSSVQVGHGLTISREDPSAWMRTSSGRSLAG